MTPANFDIALKKGEIGETIVRKRLEKQGWIVYQPATAGVHAFDMLATFQKERAIVVDIKAKARMNKYPATGINRKHFEQYLRFSEKHLMPFWVIFVDEQQGTIYGNTLEQLEMPCKSEGRQYPFDLTTMQGVEIRLWPLEKMISLGTLTTDQSEELKKHNQRNYIYEEPKV